MWAGLIHGAVNNQKDFIMIIKHSEITMIKMSVNPPQCVIDADYCVIANGKVMQYVGIGWTEIRDATPSDYERIPQILTPHCSHCRHYDILANATMYCHKLQKRITARKRPCKNYSER